MVGVVTTLNFLLSFLLRIPAEVTFRGRSHRFVGLRTYLTHGLVLFRLNLLQHLEIRRGQTDSGLQHLSKTHKVWQHRSRFLHGNNYTGDGPGCITAFSEVPSWPAPSFLYQPRICKHWRLQFCVLKSNFWFSDLPQDNPVNSIAGS